MDFLAISIALGSSLFFIIQALFNFSQYDKIFQGYSIILAISCIGFYFIKILRKKAIRKVDIFIIFFISSIIVIYFATSLIYGYKNKSYFSQLLMFGVHAIPSIMIGSMIDNSKELDKFIRWFQPIIILYTVSISHAIFSSDILNSSKGVQALNENGLSYQSISYYIAYTIGLNLFLIFYFNKIKQFRLFDNKIWRKINIILLILQLVLLFTAGGRGGVILTLVLILFFIIINRKVIFNDYKKIGFIPIIILFGALVFKFLFRIPFVMIGINRILGYIGAGVKNDYRITYHLTEALKVFYNKPIFGHGLGSVFYEFGIYTHNIFSDLLVEGGLVLTTIIIIFLCIVLYQFNKIKKYNFKVISVFLFFLFSFVMLLFSSYYFAETGIWFGAGFIFSYKNRIEISKEEK